MKLFNFLKKEKEKKEVKTSVLSTEQRLNKQYAIRQHMSRVENLTIELNELSERLEFIESNFETPYPKRSRDSDNIIHRISIIKNEIEIREGLIRWLS